MSKDIGEDILKEIRSGFAKELKNKNSGLAKIISKAENGKASFNDVSELSTQCGDVLARLIAEIVTPEILPNGRMYYNIANTFLTGSLRDNYNLLNVTAQAVQEKEDQKIGVNIEPQKADFPTERVNQIANAVSDETADWETIQRRLDAPVRNVTESFYNDYVKENAEFRSSAGLKAYIIRETNGNCCAWCSSLAGRYEYPNDVPPDVYARHDNCTCTVTYINDRQKQDFWSKKSYALTPQERKEILARTPKPERFTPEKAEEVQKNNLKGVVKAGNGGIIEAEQEMQRKSNPNQERRSDLHFVSDTTFSNLTVEARKNGANILRGGENVEHHLDIVGADASIVGDTILFRKDVCVSEVLEETHHFMQNLHHMNDDKPEPLRTYLNEIDAKEYLLNNAQKYKIPRNEIETTQKQLESYKSELEKYVKEFGEYE